jgi:general L-amino acid transport system permease protein
VHPHVDAQSIGWALFLAVLLALEGVLAFAHRIWPRFSYKAALGVMLLVVFPPLCVYLFSGGALGLQTVETPLWGGLFLTLVIALTGIVASLPLGVLLALGRRSNMPVIKSVCVVFIELWRGVPLITVLFMASVMFPLFMPDGVNFDKLLRALLGVMFFASAYMAEVVRGGLQAIPKGQYEAADALGLSYWKSMGLVILPQALKIVIPGVVNTFIGLFKDTTLVLIIGLFDFLGMAQAVSTNPDWLGFYVEGYIFVAFGFFVFCFGMSRYSLYLERKLETGHRR